MPFEIRTHVAQRIIEVVYPASPTADDVADYLMRMKEIMDAQKGHWYCLVDQRNLAALAPELLDQVAVANSYAVLHGMRRSARVVSSAVAAQQTKHIARDGAVKVKARSFTDRGEAIAWLTSPDEG